MRSTVLVAGVATGIGSLPHHDAGAAAALVLRCLPDMPAAPQLPHRSACEGLVVQGLRGIPGVAITDDGAVTIARPLEIDAAVDAELQRDAHGGLLAFLDVLRALPRAPRVVKAQVAGPLTLGVALLRAGAPRDIAFALGSRAARSWAGAVERAISESAPDSTVVLFFDEPALVAWRDDGDPPLDREVATDLLSTALASPACITGVHVCGAGDARLALAAGPNVVHVAVDTFALEDAIALGRYLDGGGWVAWGAIPTHRPIGEHPAPLWKSLLELWCELTRRGCDPVRLRTQALVAPACGLAGHGTSQAERAMLLAREIGNRVHDQAAATKLAVGA